ncbi:DUF3040 domain-containing protein [Nocardioides ferulae]|uniref:DUF3040 domain-containing protein n=1 Tax=Nocardioides ferulae TaxID=2340821 RepID=UPI000EAC5143|nr:DUF3040 domain-containing protein [Nocardioides ferulae]
MPLSEEELRLLEQMERALVEEDPKFASTLRGTTLRRTARRRAVFAGIAFVAGIAILMTGVIADPGPTGFTIGIVGFVIMLGSAYVGLAALRGSHAVAADPTAAHPSRGFTVIDGGRKGRSGRSRKTPHRPAAAQSSFMERMEERWRRRRENGGL